MISLDLTDNRLLFSLFLTKCSSGEDAYSYEFEDSALVAAASAGYSPDKGTPTIQSHNVMISVWQTLTCSENAAGIFQ